MRRIYLLAGLAVITFLTLGPRLDTGQGQIGFRIPIIVGILAAIVWWIGCGLHVVKEWERRPVMFLGKYQRTAGPFLTFIEPLLFQTLPDVPVQDVIRAVQADDVQTKDNVSIRLESVLTYRIDASRVRDAIVEVENVTSAILGRALTTLTDVASGLNLDYVLSHRPDFARQIQEEMQKRVSRWGVTVQAFEIKGLKINDPEIERSIALRARAEKEAQAELVRAQMQKTIAEALNEAGGTLKPEGWRMKMIEVFLEAVRGPNNTYIVPSQFLDSLASMFPDRKFIATS